MTVSLVIPVWDMYGVGAYFLEKLLESVKVQTLIPNEIVISDHSQCNHIQSFCKNQSLPIKYLRNSKKLTNAAQNLNYGIQHASGEIIKILFQDDYFAEKNALEIGASNLFKSSHSWYVCASRTINLQTKASFVTSPSWNKNLLKGVNTIGSPSVVTFKRNKILFDENIRNLYDCEFYYRMIKEHGQPIYDSTVLINVQANHQYQQTTMISKNYFRQIIQKYEIYYCLLKNLKK